MGESQAMAKMFGLVQNCWFMKAARQIAIVIFLSALIARGVVAVQLFRHLPLHLTSYINAWVLLGGSLLGALLLQPVVEYIKTIPSESTAARRKFYKTIKISGTIIGAYLLVLVLFAAYGLLSGVYQGAKDVRAQHVAPANQETKDIFDQIPNASPTPAQQQAIPTLDPSEVELDSPQTKKPVAAKAKPQVTWDDHKK